MHDELIELKEKQDLIDKPAERKERKIVGTPDYIPPEVLNLECISNPSMDWWALGVIVYEMVVGQAPFSDNRVKNIFEKI